MCCSKGTTEGTEDAGDIEEISSEKLQKEDAGRPISELTSDEIDEWMAILQEQYGRRISGLQASVLGQFRKGASLPKFRTVGRNRFVQILNDQSDHWVCVTNVFGDTSHDVFVYDSLFEVLHDSIIVQVSSLLRDDTSEDEIVFHVRSFRQQK